MLNIELTMLIKNTFAVLLLLLCMPVLAATLEQNLKTENQTQTLGQQSQQKVNQLDRESRELLNEYQRLMRQTDYQKAYNDELKQSLKSQEETINSLKKQLEDVQLTRLHILPFLKDKSAQLKAFIQLDLPFQQQQRLDSVERLEKLLNSGKYNLAEKYRRVMEAWQAESDLSYELNHYRAELDYQDKRLSGNFLQIGRIALLFQSLDGKLSLLWDKKAKAWQPINDKDAADIQKALRIANKQIPPEFLALPITGAEK